MIDKPAPVPFTLALSAEDNLLVVQLSASISDVQYAFHLKTEVAHKRDGGMLVLEKLCLAFEELAEAERWRQAIAQQVEKSVDKF